MMARVVVAESVPGDRHAGVLQHVPAERVGVVRKPTAVGVDVEGAFRQHRNIEAQLLEGRYEKVSLRAVQLATLFQEPHSVGVEGRERGLLGQVRRGDVRLPASLSTSNRNGSGTTSQPRRNLVMPKYLEKLLMTKMSSPNASAVGAAGP